MVVQSENFINKERFMETVEMRHTSLFDIIRDLRDDVKTFIKDEIQLAKTELTQKFAIYGRNAVWLAIGGVCAFTGLLLFLAGIGALLAFAFTTAGLSSTLAWFLGLLIVGLGIIGMGANFILKAVKTFSQESLKPERTVETLQTTKAELAPSATTTTPEPEAPKALPRSAEQIQTEIHATRNNMELRLAEIQERLKPRYVGKRFVRQVKAHPIRSSLITAGTSLAGYLAIKRRMHNHHD
jgi:hypothetical protein